MDDLHRGTLRGNPIRSDGWVFVRLTQSADEDDDICSIHFDPMGTMLGGVKEQGFARQIGCQPYDNCQFAMGHDKRCQAMHVPSDFDFHRFTKVFRDAFQHLIHASRPLEECGFDEFFPEQNVPPEVGNGHDLPLSGGAERMQDEHFVYVLSSVSGPRLSGWVVHYRPKTPLPELEPLLSVLGLQRYERCPEFNHEGACYWRFIRQVNYGERSYNQNNWDAVVRGINGHPIHFYRGLELIGRAQKLIEPFGISMSPLLPLGSTAPKAGLVYAFLDANTLIHFQTFDEVDWPKVLDARRVRIVLVPSALRELNKFKDDRTNSWRRDRVRGLWSKLRPLLEGGDSQNPNRVRRNVAIFDLVDEPDVEWRDLNLDPMSEDDRYIASILAFASEQPLARIVLVTNDFPLRRKATTRGIAVVDPADHIARLDLKNEN